MLLLSNILPADLAISSRRMLEKVNWTGILLIVRFSLRALMVLSPILFLSSSLSSIGFKHLRTAASFMTQT